ncbi:meiosis-specific nuclear structural protein 1 [Pseudoscourfieldia marina]
MAGSLARQHELMQHARRLEEDRSLFLKNEVSTDIALRDRFGIEERSSKKQREREVRERIAESQQVAQLYNDARAAHFQRQQAREEDALALELERRKKASEAHAREVQKVREESEELRWLQEKLRAAEMNMQRKLQLDEKVMLGERAKAEEARYDEMMEGERQKLVARLEKEAYDRRMFCLEQKRVLQEQMDEKVEVMEQARLEYERERAQIDAVVAQIQAEDVAELERKREKQAETQDYIKHFLKEQEEFKAAERARMDEEERQIAAHAAEIARRDAEAQAAKAAKQNAADKRLEELKRIKEAADREKEEMEELLNELHFQEQEEKYVQKERDAREKKERERQEMMQANAYLKELRQQRLAQEHEEEMLFRKHLLEKFAEDDRIEQMNAQRRRMKMEEHKREVQRLWEEKQARFNAQREAEMAEMAAALARDERRADIVEAERQRLLREHAARLAEYLPKGVLQYESDLALIGK